MKPVITKGIRRSVPRKQRFHWTHALHLRFVNAVIKLGGPIAATPQTILNLMNVEAPGLTRNTVKNHLQTYRYRIFQLAAEESPNSSTQVDRREIARHVSEAIKQKQVNRRTALQDDLDLLTDGIDAQTLYKQNILNAHLAPEMSLIPESNNGFMDFGSQPPRNVFETERNEDLPEVSYLQELMNFD